MSGRVHKQTLRGLLNLLSHQFTKYKDKGKGKEMYAELGILNPCFDREPQALKKKEQKDCEYS